MSPHCSTLLSFEGFFVDILFLVSSTGQIVAKYTRLNLNNMLSPTGLVLCPGVAAPTTTGSQTENYSDSQRLVSTLTCLDLHICSSRPYSQDISINEK